MYYAPKEHNPPHIHVYYNGYNATIEISNCKMLSGKLPVRQQRLANAWIEIHRE